MKDKIIQAIQIIVFLVIIIFASIVAINDQKAECEIYEGRENVPIKCQINENITK